MKKLIAFTLVVCMLLLPLTACGNTPDAATDTPDTGASTTNAPEESASSDSQEDVVITMWTFLDPTNTTNGRSVALAQMIEEFEADHPGVTINVEPQDWVTMTAKFLSATSTGDAPDIIWCARDELCGVLNAGALVPLEDLFLGDWSEEEKADVDDVFFQFGERDGKHYTLTLSKNAIVLYYRQDLLEKANLQVPTSWEDIMEVAQATTGEDADTGIYRYGMGQAFSTESADPQLISNYILSKQGDLFNDDGTANWANDVGVSALEWTAKCLELGVTPEEALNLTNEDMFVEFGAGKYAMMLGGGVRAASFKSAASFDADAIQIAEIPGGCVLDGWFVGVWSGSQNPEMAGKFIEKMYSPEADELWVTLGGQAPIRKSTLETQKDYFNTEATKYLAVLVSSFENGWMPTNEVTLNGWKFDLNSAVQNALYNKSDYLAALQEAATNFNTANGR